MAKSKYLSYWLTRSLRNGKLEDKVSVWIVKPERCALPSGDVVWFGWKPSNETALYSTWTIAQCLYECRVYPETDLELIRYGEEPNPLPPKIS